MRVVLVSIFIAMISFGLPAFGEPDSTSSSPYTVLATPRGVLVIWNESPVHFTLEIAGEEVRPSNIGGVAFFVDGQHVQVITVDTAQFAPKGATPGDILKHHMTFESRHFETQIGVPMPGRVLKPSAPLPPDMALWGIKWSRKARKKTGADTIKTLFLTTAFEDRVVVVTLSLMKGQSESDAIVFLESVANSLGRFNSEIDVSDLQKSLRR